MPSHGVRLGPSGELEVVRAAPPEDVGALRATLDVLRRATGTGAVEILDVVEDVEKLEVVLAFAGRPVAAPLPAARVRRVGSSLAATLADLHARGIAHGAVRADHVLVDAVGATRLCGFGAAGDGDPSDDVLALGGLLHALLDPDDASDDARPVRGIADRCCCDDAASRPTVAAIAAALASAGEPRRVIARPSADTSSSRRVQPIAAAIVAAVVVAAIVFGLLVVPRSGGPSAQPSATTAPTVARRTSTSTSSSTTTLPSRRVWPPAPPQIIEAHGTWTLGTVDDRIYLADWDGDGVQTPAVLRTDGDVFVISEWVDGARGTYVTTVAGIVDAAVEHTPSGDVLVVTTSGGRTVRLDLSAA